MKNSYFLGSNKDIQNYAISEISSTIPVDYFNSNSKTGEPFWKCRYALVLIGFLLFFYKNCYRLNLSVTLVAMVNNTVLIQKASGETQSCPSLIPNNTMDPQSFGEAQWLNAEFIWSPQMQGYILSIYNIGYVVGQIPAGALAERFGSKWFLFASAFLSGVCTLIIPQMSRISPWAFLQVNAVRGIVQGLVQPGISVLTANWFPKMERGLLYTIILSGNGLGSFSGSVFSGLLCEHSGWPSSFYTFGAGAIVLSIAIVFLIYESPHVHPSISKAEYNFILKNQECALSQRRPDVPWRKILTSPPVLALSLASFGQMWALSQFGIVHSTYLGTILHYPIDENGLFSALPFLLQLVVAQITAFVSSHLQRKGAASVDGIRKWNTLLASVGCSACMLGIYLAGCNRNLSILFSVASMGFTGIGFGGCWITPVDMSPQFAGSLNALSLTVACLSSVILPLVVGYLTNEMQTIEQWNKVMFISMGVVLTTGILFAIFGSAEVQPWNSVKEDQPKYDDETEDRKECEMTRF